MNASLHTTFPTSITTQLSLMETAARNFQELLADFQRLAFENTQAMLRAFVPPSLLPEAQKNLRTAKRMSDEATEDAEEIGHEIKRATKRNVSAGIKVAKRAGKQVKRAKRQATNSVKHMAKLASAAPTQVTHH